ncbi:MAG: hypothetical protein QOJ26_1023 [Thermoplasmata archaeon]|jgi:hypothetical protein|nr:hypothetical protein [Thermoplasmata archaeon]
MRGDENANSQVIAFSIAGSIFIAALAGILLFGSSTARDRSTPREAVETQNAESLADLLLDSPGVGWDLGADDLTRLGLRSEDGAGLDQDSIDALKGAMLDSSSNGKVDYDDARASVGLDPTDAKDFHLRIYPIGMESVFDASESGLRVGYVADWSSLASVTVPLGTPTAQLVNQANVKLNLTMAANTYRERDAITSLGLDFNNRVYMTAATPAILVDLPLIDLPLLTVLNVPLIEGDVYPDNKAYIDAVLAGRLHNYDVLVVGSGVDQSTLTASATKNGIRDWVLAGGTLIVLGSSAQGYQWLEPLFTVGVATVNGAPTAPDVAHPLLKEPNVLAWTGYDFHGRSWDLAGQGSNVHYNDFSHVVVSGGKDVLAISKDGAFGGGRIIVTTYMPREIAQTLGAGEASNVFENMVLFADHSNLYLEYGATAPDDVPVAVAIRQSWLHDETLGQVPVRIEVQTWSA